MNRDGPCSALMSKQNSNNFGVRVMLTQTWFSTTIMCFSIRSIDSEDSHDRSRL